LDFRQQTALHGALSAVLKELDRPDPKCEIPAMFKIVMNEKINAD
jgi:hypothetical protein